jgi:hypothetical protein
MPIRASVRTMALLPSVANPVFRPDPPASCAQPLCVVAKGFCLPCERLRARWQSLWRTLARLPDYNGRNVAPVFIDRTPIGYRAAKHMCHELPAIVGL